MLFFKALVVATCSVSVLAQLPANGIYHIVNVANRFRWDVRASNSTPGTDIIGFTNRTSDNQKFNAQQIAVQGGSGIYTFTAVLPPLGAYVNSVVGNPLHVQPYKTPFSVTPRPAGASVKFFITIPTNLPGNQVLAVTGPASVPRPAFALTLQPLDESNDLQAWEFEPV